MWPFLSEMQSPKGPLDIIVRTSYTVQCSTSLFLHRTRAFMLHSILCNVHTDCYLMNIGFSKTVLVRGSALYIMPDGI